MSDPFIPGSGLSGANTAIFSGNEGAFPVFNSQGKMMGNLTSNQGQPPTTQLQGSTLSQGIQGSTISTPAGASVPNTSTSNPAASASTAGASSPAIGSGSLADYFARAIIILLGFIFIAVGLNMLRPGTVPIPRRM